MSYTVIITEEIAANIAVTTQNYPITIEYNATNLADGGSYGNANVAAYLASGTNSSIIDNIGNISTTGSIAAGGIVIATGNVTGGNIRTAGQVSATGNITGSYFLGNGSQLTGLPATYSDANVTTLLAAFGSNTISTTGNVTSGYIIANGSALTNLTGANVTGTVANATYATSAGSASTATLATYATTANAVAGANVSGTVANATYALTSNAATYASVATFADTANAVAGANVTGTVANATYATSAGSATTAGTANTALNVNAANVTGTFGSISVTGNISSQSGNIEAVTGQFIGNGSGITIVLGGNVHGAVAEAQQVTGAAQGNITSVGTLTSLSVSGNIVGGNISTAGQISAGGNVTANNYSTGGIVSATGTVTGGNIVSLGTVTAAGNLQSIQQTVIGTANATNGTGNIVVSGKNIATDMAFNPDGGNAVTAALSRINIGTGWNGNITHSANQNRLVVQDTFNRTNTGTGSQLFASDPIVNLTGNVTNNAFRVQGVGARVRIGGGSAGNTISLSGGSGAIAAVAALQPNIDVGNVAPYNLGNTTISHATLNGGFITTYPGGFVGNAYGMVPGSIASGTGNAAASGNITNYIGFSSQLSASPYITGNLYGFYHPNVAGSAEQSATGLAFATAARSATNYYAFRNDDPVAQVKLGSLRTYHEYQYSTATSGTVNIDKNNAQVQYIAPTANVTIGTFDNFVTTASNTSSSLNQSDTVTLIIKQGATPYTVTMPTGNAAIKYASGNSTVGTSANSVTMINITGSNIGGAAMYLVTVSPEFT